MSFLESSTTPNQTESSIILDNESSQHEETSHIISSVANEESADQPIPSTSCDATTVPENTQQSGSSHQIYRRQRRINMNPTDRMIDYLENRRKHNSNDEKVMVKCDGIDLLFLGYADSFKKLSKQTQANVKFNIAKIMMEAELNDLEAERNTSSRTSNYSNDTTIHAPVTPGSHWGSTSNTPSHTTTYSSMNAPVTPGNYSTINNDIQAANQDSYDINITEPADLSTSTYFSQFSSS